jgi:hypothetical protein
VERKAKRWIVLINKSPKGPLSEDDIRSLLQQNVLRRNDIAYLLPDDPDSKSPTEWKLLWQFPEFDRRREDTPAPVTQERIVTAEERRRKENELKAQKAALGELPADLLNISPEDLIPRISPLSPTNEKAPLLEAGSAARDASESTLWARLWHRPARVLGAAGALSLVVAIYVLGLGRETAEVTDPFPMEFERSPAEQGQPPLQRRVLPQRLLKQPALLIPAPQGNEPLASRAPEAARDPDRGEILPSDEEEEGESYLDAPRAPRAVRTYPDSPIPQRARSKRSVRSYDEDEPTDEPSAEVPASEFEPEEVNADPEFE